MALSASNASRASKKKHVPACLSSGSLQLKAMDGNLWVNKTFHFIPPHLKHPSSIVKHLFAQNHLLSVGEILKQFTNYYSDSNPDPYGYTWKLFVETQDLDINGQSVYSYAQINQLMPFLNIPEYILNNNYLVICTKRGVGGLSTRGIILPFHATEPFLVDSANHTVVSNVTYNRNCVAKFIDSLHSAQNPQGYLQRYPADYRIKVVAIIEDQLARSRRLCKNCISEALKHQQTQHNVRLVATAPEHPQPQNPVVYADPSDTSSDYESGGSDDESGGSYEIPDTATRTSARWPFFSAWWPK